MDLKISDLAAKYNMYESYIRFIIRKKKIR